MILLKFYETFVTVFLFVTTVKAAYRLEYVDGESPPASIPADPRDRIYSVAVNSITSEAVKAVVYDSSNQLMETGDFDDVLRYQIETLDVNAVSNSGYVDPWINSGGHLVMWGNKAPIPDRLSRNFFTHVTENSRMLRNFTIDKGALAVDGLIHRHPDGDKPPNNRVYRFTLFLSDGSSVFRDTNPFEITAEARSVVPTSSFPTTVEAGEPFSVSFEILDKNGARLTTGTDSVLYGELQVAWENDTVMFYDRVNHENILYKEMVRMRGPNVQQKKATLNYVQRVQFSSGVASFDDVSILDVYSGLRLNLTVFLSRFPWTRRPDLYSDLASKVICLNEAWDSLFFMNMSYPTDPAVFLSTPFDVTAQDAVALVITTKASVKPVQNANFPIDDKIEIEIRDAQGKRIYSGPDSRLNVTVTATPGGTCVSADANFVTVDGKGVFMGSICSLTAGVTLQFDAVSVNTGTPLSDNVGPITFNNEIHLASFAALGYSGSGQNLGGHFDSFSHFAAMDINDPSSQLLQGRELIMHSFNTDYKILETVKQYKIMKAEGEADSSKKVRAIIGFGDNSISEAMQKYLTADEMLQLGTAEDLHAFSDKAMYPYFNRICWDMGSMAHSVMLAAKSRTWTKAVALRCRDVTIDEIFFAKAKQFEIEILELTIPKLRVFEFFGTGMFDTQITEMKHWGTKIIWLFCRSPELWKVIKELWLAEISPQHGYQWVTLGHTTWMMPYENGIFFCDQDPLCTEMARGSQGFAPTYNIQGFHTALWEHVLKKHIKKDMMTHAGSIPQLTLPVLMAELGLGYDAVLLIATAMDSLISRQLTVTGLALAAEIRQVQIDGLTGHLELDSETGNRPGYTGVLIIMDPWNPVHGAQMASSAIVARYFEMGSLDATDQLEYKVAVQWPLSTGAFNYTEPINPYTLPKTTWLNKRRYYSSDGMIDSRQRLIPIPPAKGLVTFSTVEEETVAPFYCVKGCGGARIDDFDITRYEFGDCSAQDVCSCHEGYYGKTCTKIVCNCRHGECDRPGHCICEPGHVGPLCEYHSCYPACIHGHCSAPDICSCDSGYFGGDCSHMILVDVLVPCFILILIIVGVVFAVRWFVKHQALKAALKNLDWRCLWDEEIQTGMDATSMAASLASKSVMEFTKKNYVSWKMQKCYTQKFNCDTLDVNSSDLRMEVLTVKELRHNNLVLFVGACLEWPNVCILTECCQKGSIEDLLANDSVKLGWDFRYALLKDICRGMAYIHKSKLRSHGRLKSSNCLVDNRWTCKVAGFGVPTFRYKGPRKELPDEEGVVSNKLKTLYWTAPELLTRKPEEMEIAGDVQGDAPKLSADITHINEVERGTQAGDVYSFAVIITEIISREEPYSFEALNLTTEEIIQLVRDKNAPSAVKAKRRWYESGGDTTKLFRPKIDESQLPEEYVAKTGLKKLCEQNWSEEPEMRLTFKQSLEKLNEIYPIKGELVDNLVGMLEKYSTNLELIVAERTTELIAEKAKTEQLVSQILPKKVVQDLKHGRPVEPETFECVTIFFSDLVGFTAIARQSTPLEVVDLLNDLYTTFDAILDHYDVYKVETIGDAYMVTSGLPERNGDNHAGEIASVSLDLLSSVCDFKIRHMPGEILQLRIGMHSGPCVAGVVGLKMPRYCLFGDTVNTASRMESSSKALRIHMSQATADILIKLGGYHLECRGEREVKGKGMMTTYWLEGKDGFEKPLPKLELAASDSKHEFK